MAKYTGPSCRLCRREGEKLYLKGDRCYGTGGEGYKATCPFDKNGAKVTPPGPVRSGRKKTSGYSLQLREKQKTKRTYGILEKQFYMYFKKAEKMKGVTGENMLILIERRLDNVVFRMGIAQSRAQARQIVCHGHIAVNGSKVDIPSYLISAGDVITVMENSANNTYFKELKEEGVKQAKDAAWLTFSSSELKGEVVQLPKRDDIDNKIKEHMIVELYSK